MAWFLIVGGVVLAALAAFAWQVFARLPVHALRSKMYGSGVARGMTVISGIVVAVLGAFLLFME